MMSKVDTFGNDCWREACGCVWRYGKRVKTCKKCKHRYGKGNSDMCMH